MIRKKYRIKRRRRYKKKRGRYIFGDDFKSFYNIGKAWCKRQENETKKRLHNGKT